MTQESTPTVKVGQVYENEFGNRGVVTRLDQLWLFDDGSSAQESDLLAQNGYRLVSDPEDETRDEAAPWVPAGPGVRRTMQEFADNMGFSLEGLPLYGLEKVARAASAAAVARAEKAEAELDDYRLAAAAEASLADDHARQRDKYRRERDEAIARAEKAEGELHERNTNARVWTSARLDEVVAERDAAIKRAEKAEKELAEAGAEINRRAEHAQVLRNARTISSQRTKELTAERDEARAENHANKTLAADRHLELHRKETELGEARDEIQRLRDGIGEVLDGLIGLTNRRSPESPRWRNVAASLWLRMDWAAGKLRALLRAGETNG